MDTLEAHEARQDRYRVLAGAVTWALVAFVYLGNFGSGAWDISRWLGLAAILAYGAGIFVATRRDAQWPTPSQSMRHAALALAALALFLMILTNSRDVVFILAIIMAAVLPEHFRLGRAALLQLLLHGTMTVLYIWRWEPGSWFIMQSLLWLGFDAFALLTSHVAAEERRTRRELQFTNQQLSATQNMLAATGRQEERLRISRDLHDTAGHHLTGLSLLLEAASHSDGEKAREHVREARMIARLLLADIREVVSELRGMRGLNLVEALRSLQSSGSRLQVELDIPDELDVADLRVAETVFRVVQEIITNAVRHACAARLKVHIAANASGLLIKAGDDGALRQLPREGNGLKGMRERVEALGGSLALSANPGLSYDIYLPLEPA